MDVARQVIDIARWAPSGDNTQPWRFEIADPAHIVVHGFDTRSDCVYDLEGHASHIAHGALLQSMIYAGSELGYAVEWVRRPDSADNLPIYDVRLRPESDLRPHALAPYIKFRSTQRRPMRPGILTSEEKRSLEEAAGEGYHLRWWDSLKERFRFARFLFQAARLRLITPEAFEVHRRIIEWGATDSRDKIPESAVGMSPLTLRLSQWTFGSWGRMHFMNSIPGATWFPRIELDFLPGLFCAGHYVLIADEVPQTLEDYVNAGMAVQRVWLQIAALGLQQQPEMTPLIFRTYVLKNIEHTKDEAARAAAKAFAGHSFWRSFTDDEFKRMCWVARVGRREVKTRSTRLPIDALMADENKL